MVAFQKRRCFLLLAALAGELRFAHCGESQCGAESDDGKASLLQRTHRSPRRQGKQLDEHRVAKKLDVKPYSTPSSWQESSMQHDTQGASSDAKPEWKIQHEANAGGAAQSEPTQLYAQVPSWDENISTSDIKAQSVALDLILEGLIEDMAPGSTRDLLTAFRLCAPCDRYERFGELNDGGFMMCTDDLSVDLAGAFSYGNEGFDGWGLAIAARYNISVHEYDCSNSSFPTPCAGCDIHFHNECILASQGVPEDKYKTLSQHLKESSINVTNEGSLLLKIDINGDEWKFFLEEPIENLRKFRQIVVQYNSLEATQMHPLYLQAVNNIEQAGFAVTHLQGNNCCRMENFNVSNATTSSSLEVTYIRKPVQGCANM